MDVPAIVAAALEEDINGDDITTDLVVDAGAVARGRVVSRLDGILSGLAPFVEVFRQLDQSLKVTCHFDDGQPFETGDVICELKGSTKAILKGERTALNFLGRLSGIATLTRQYVDAVSGTGTAILDTRKTTPLLRALEKAAVLHGGGCNHRFGLYDMILVKDNHESAAGGISTALSRATAYPTQNLPVEVEVQNVEQLDEVLKFDVDRILLDNFSKDMIEKAVDKVAKRIPLEVSGGVTLENVREIALMGVDFISVGALTHSAPSMDFSLLLDL